MTSINLKWSQMTSKDIKLPLISTFFFKVGNRTCTFIWCCRLDTGIGYIIFSRRARKSRGDYLHIITKVSFQSFISSLFSIIIIRFSASPFEEMMWKLFLLSPPRLSFVWCIILSLLKIESAAKWPKMAFSTPFSGEIQDEIGVESWAKQE